ncbi:MAG: Ig-like domain-containing protein [Bacteroidota bacterium]
MRALSLATILALGFLTTLPAFAQTTFVVTKTADTNDGMCDSDCTLREAIAAAEAAAGDDIIRFDSALDGLTISPTSKYVINTNVEIDAVTGLSDGITLNGNALGFNRLVLEVFPLSFSVPANTVRLAGLTLLGAAIFNQSTMTVDQCTIRGSSQGAIQNESTLLVTNSTISGNSSSGSGEAAGISNQTSTLTIENSTISGNTTSATGTGAAIHNPGGTVTVRNSTFSGNTHTLGQTSGILGGTVTLGNTVFESGGGGNFDFATLISEGFNICDDACGLSGTGDLTSTDPQLGPLADNGGPTLTHTLLTGSPAIDIGGTCGTADQRGESAPVAGTFAGSAACDAGAVELATPPPPSMLVVNTADGGDDGACGTDAFDPVQDCSLREAVAAANSNPDANTITFDALGQGNIVLEADLVITTPITIDGVTGDGGTYTSQVTGNDVYGIVVTGAAASNSVIQGLVIGDAPVALRLDDGVSGVQVLGNFIGADSDGADSFFRNGTAGLVITGGSTNNTIGGIGAIPMSGASKGNVFGFSPENLVLEGTGTTGNTVIGNFFSTNEDGDDLATDVIGISRIGVAIRTGASDNTIGGTTTDERNVFGFLRGDGILIEDAGTTGNIVQGNFIGTDLDGFDYGLPSGSGMYIRNEASDNTIGGTSAGAGNTIGFNGGTGILIQFANTTGNVVQGNFIGTNANGDNYGNRNGIWILGGASNNTIGGSAAGAANTIGHNTEQGLILQNTGTTGNTIQGNFIGTNAAGADLGNGAIGVRILFGPSDNTIGGSGAGEGNTIGFNVDGIQVANQGASPTGNQILGNYIGTNAAGANLGNSRDGVSIGGNINTNTVGGTAPGAGNTIGFNAEHGIRIGFSNGIVSIDSDIVVQGNFVGTNAAGADLGNGIHGILLVDDAQNNTIGGAASGAGNTIGFNGGSGIVISEAPAASNVVQGNFVGTNAAGADLGNTENGILVNQAAASNTIGGANAGEGNTVGFNGGSGIVLIDGSTTNNTVLGNYVGTNPAGVDLGNTLRGILIAGSATNNTIGGTNAGEGNTVGFNALNGIRLEGSGTSNNTVRGNLVGTDATGANLGNTGKGISVAGGASNNTIGGTGAAEGNTVGFSSLDGIEVAGNGTSGNSILGNFVGTNAAGDDLGNTNFGVTLIFGASNNTVGGDADGAENTVGFNGLAGVYLNTNSTGNTVLGNFVGTNAAGADLGNDGNGVQLFNAPTNTIGGTGADDGNTIANNGVGINVEGEPAVGNALLGNHVFDNSGLGIDLLPFGVAANDGCTDADVGPNGFQNYPVLASAIADGGTTTINYDLDTAAGTYRVELFSVTTPDASGNGEGRTFLTAQDVTVTSDCGETFQVVLPTQLATTVSVTATATPVTTGLTSTFGGTSEFSAALGVTLAVGTIGDLVFFDTNGDGDQDAGEDGLEGITVFLDANDNDELDDGEERATTDASGAYDLTDVLAGTYTVKVDTTTLADGFVLTTGVDPIFVELAALEDFNDADFGYRLECAPGFFLDPDDPTTCLPAPPGTFVASAGATEAEPCVPGTFQPLEGQTSCDPAPAGRFVAIERATEAEACAVGTYQPLEGQTACLDADPGNFVPAGEAIAQSPCVLGTFQPEAGQALCLPAPVGSYVDMEEATFATACPAGTTTDGEGATSASDCVAITAQTFMVTKTDDTNDGTCDADCSLREAIAAADANVASAADTITFSPAVTSTIALGGSHLVLSTDVVIEGPGAAVLAVSGNRTSRVFETTASVEIRDLTITGGLVQAPPSDPGATQDGGGIYNSGTLTLSRCVVSENSADGSGGGIINAGGTLVLRESTVAENAAGGIVQFDGATLTVSNSTISNNTGDGINSNGFVDVTRSTFQGNEGSGIAASGSSSVTGEDVIVSQSTFSGNVVGIGLSSGGRARVTNSTFRDNGTASISLFIASQLTIGNSIIDTGDTGTSFASAGSTINSLGHNVCGDACGLTGPGDLTETDPLLDVLADNGGPTLMHALLPGSPAIDIGGTCGPTDQRGFDAPIIGLASNSTALCDAGSFETEILDAEPPTVVIASTLDDPTASQPIPLTFTFSEVVSGFSADDIDVSGGTLGALTTTDSTTFAADLTPDGVGTLTVDIDADVATDLAGNPNEAAEPFSITFDNDGPTDYTAAFDQTAVSATNETAITFTIRDAEEGASFVYTISSDGGAGEITGSGIIGGAAPRLPGGVNDVSQLRGNKGGGFELTFVSTLTSEQVTDIDVSSLPDGTLTLSVTLTDALGNEGDAATDAVLKDTVAPTVVVSTTAPNPTSVEPIPVTFAFSEEVTSFEASDVTVTGGTLTDLAGAGDSYTAYVDPDGSGEITVTVAAGVAADTAGNPSAASNTLGVTFDGDAPAVVVSTTAPDPTSTEPIPVTFTFSEEMTGFDASDVTVTGGTLGALTTEDNASFTGEIDPDGSGEVTVTVAADVATDAAGNGNAASNPLTITFDGEVPVLTISTPTPEPTVQSPFPVTFTFSEDVTGFDATDVDVTNGTLSDLAGAGDTYTALVTPTDFGVVTVSVDAGVATDGAGNGNTADTLTRTYDERFDLALSTEFAFTGPGTGTLTAIVTNTGSVPATRVRVKITKTFDVATGPKQLVIGTLAPGEQGTAVFDFGSAGTNAEVRLKAEDLVVRDDEENFDDNRAIVFLIPGDGGADTVAPEITGALSGQLFAGTAEENRIDDTGVATLVLDPGAVNLTLAVDPFAAGTTVVSYTATPIDPAQDASGTIRATDLEGNPATFFVSIPAPPPPGEETLVVRLTPDDAPIFIGNGGGSFTFTGEVTNPTDGRLTQDVWLVLISPSGLEEVQFGPFRVRLGAGGMTAERFTVTVDREAEAGVYAYEGRVGDFPGAVTDTDRFTFEKLGNGSREAEPLALGRMTNAMASDAPTNAAVVLPVLTTTAGLVWGITDDAEWAALGEAEASEKARTADGKPESADPAEAKGDAVTDNASEDTSDVDASDEAATDATDANEGASNAKPDAGDASPEHASDEPQVAETDAAEDTPVGAAPVEATSVALPDVLALGSVYPNPFTHRATVEVALPEPTDLSVTVYDLTGRLVATLARGTLDAGYHALDLDGAALGSGVYLVRLATADGTTQTRRVTLVR